MSKKLLIVDDNESNRRLLAAVLSRHGYQIELAESVEQAVESMKAHSPDLILMDLQMPDEDGLSLTRKLKANVATEHIPIIAVTACAMPDDERAAFAAGCVGFITKPIDTRGLPQIVARHLQKHD
ncbi:MAG: response regulator [Oceanococcus sp.]